MEGNRRVVPHRSKQLYADFRSIVYNVGYSARETRTGKEAMFFSPNMEIPALVGPIPADWENQKRRVMALAAPELQSMKIGCYWIDNARLVSF